MNENKRINTGSIGSAGEFYALSIFLRQGFVAGKAPENTADFDLFLMSNDAKSFKPIQVKTVTNANHWILKEKHESLIKNLFYCFIKFTAIHDATKMYLVPSDVVSNAITIGHQIYLNLPGIKGKTHKESSMRTFKTDYSSLISKVKDPSIFLTSIQLAFIQSHSNGWLDRYENNFSIFD
jgi:hypothetical protein